MTDVPPDGNTTRPAVMQIGRRRDQIQAARPDPERIIRPEARRALVAGLVWGIALFAALVYVWGTPDRVAFGSPDEALTRRAIDLIAETGFPVLDPPFEDPDGLFKQRLWAVVDNQAVPTHNPFQHYLYAAFGRAIPFGEWIVFVLPAVGLGALVSACALMLRRYYWLALLVPGLAFPLTFRFLKPWENMSTAVSLLALAVLFSVIWARGARRPWMYLMWICTALAAAVRPDQSYAFLGLVLLAGLAIAAPRERLLVWLSGGAAGFFVLGTFFLGNLAVTGDAAVPPAYLLATREGAGVFGKNLDPPFSYFASLFLPTGVPTIEVIRIQISKYWWDMGPIWVLTVGAPIGLSLAVRRLFRRRAFGRIWALLAGMAVIGFFLATRVSETNFGASATEPSISHSYPRYVALAYLAATVLVIVAVASVKQRISIVAAGSLLTIAALAGFSYLYQGEVRTSLKDAAPLISSYEEYAEASDKDLPPDAVLYVRFADKFLWSVRPTATLPTEPGALKEDLQVVTLVSSFREAIESGFRPFVFELTQEEYPMVQGEAAESGLRLEPRSVGETQTVSELLLRWSVWEVVADG